MTFKIIQTPEPHDHCAVYPRRACNPLQRECDCNKCELIRTQHKNWRKGISREKRLAECLRWRAELGLPDDIIRVYGLGVVDSQQITLIDPPICTRTGRAAATTHCSCNTCSAYRKYYYELTGERLLPLSVRYRKTKKCSKCGKHKKLSEFHYDVSTKDGLKAKCKTCRKR